MEASLTPTPSKFSPRVARLARVAEKHPKMNELEKN
jgi:hypothetical protein